MPPWTRLGPTLTPTPPLSAFSSSSPSSSSSSLCSRSRFSIVPSAPPTSPPSSPSRTASQTFRVPTFSPPRTSPPPTPAPPSWPHLLLCHSRLGDRPLPWPRPHWLPPCHHLPPSELTQLLFFPGIVIGPISPELSHFFGCFFFLLTLSLSLSLSSHTQTHRAFPHLFPCLLPSQPPSSSSSFLNPLTAAIITIITVTFIAPPLPLRSTITINFISFFF
ncbi:hypothetical protein CDL15_Pgr024729 [Punica granatum]|uniref:Uncharacterized protein n=1 Tax=Punica granatum TaxID=22663 RepID=A0A218W457_PUNGR|nr:hypothetical protein CDL15_Pgr024729 [Punica granatum]